MKQQLDRLIGAFIVLILLSSNLLYSQSNQEEQVTYPPIDTLQLLRFLQDELVANINEKHITPPEIDDQFSTILFSNWIEIIDPNKSFLYANEMKELSNSLYDLDDQLNQSEVTFFELSRKLVLRGIQRNLKVFEELKQSNFDFSVNEIYDLNSNLNTYVDSDQELRERYRRYAKYRILELFNELLSNASNQNSVQSISKDSLLASAKTEFYNLEKGKFKILRIKDKINYFEDYLDAIVRTFDPYCDYYSEVEKQDYDVEITGKVVGIGVFIENEHGQHQITQIAVGGPAWRTEKVEVGDLLQGATTQSGEYVSFEDLSVLETAGIIRGKVGTSLTVHLLSKDSIQKDVKIYREEFLGYGEQVKGLILNRDENNEIGYIDIRRFYKSKSPGKHSSSADDVIDYLKYYESNEVKSLIIDLRDCVGGVLEESLSILGALVGSGPLLQSRDRKDSLSIYQSETKKPVYTGNVIVLTNQNSASAAEILTSTLQDYRRAIILGGKTYGKGTVQTFYNLQEGATNDLPGFNQYGWLKYTFSKYYRVNGDATQLVGVTPDIILPSILDSIAVTESEKKNAILWSQIKPVKYDENLLLSEKIRALNIMSKIRVASNSNFKKVKRAALELNDLYADTNVPLSLSEYRAYKYLQNSTLRNASNASFSEIPLMEVTIATPQAKLSMTAEESRWIALRSQDIYIDEAMNVLEDLSTMP